MRKVLRVTAMVSGILSLSTALVLGFIYLEDLIKYLISKRKQLTDGNGSGIFERVKDEY